MPYLVFIFLFVCMFSRQQLVADLSFILLIWVHIRGVFFFLPSVVGAVKPLFEYYILLSIIILYLLHILETGFYEFKFPG